MKRTSNEVIDLKLMDKNIKRLGEYTSANKPILCRCIICMYEWSPLLGNVFSKNTGCPKCAGGIGLPNSEIDTELQILNIKRIDEFSQTRRMGASMTFQCLKCDCVWTTSLTHIINGGKKCPNCVINNRRLNNNIIDERLMPLHIKRLTDYNIVDKTAKFLCLIEDCHYEWTALASSVSLNKKGCPKCGGNIKLTNEDVDNRLQGRNIKRLENYISNEVPIKFQCLIESCGRIWSTAPNCVLNIKSGCPWCNVSKNEKMIHSLLVKNDIDFEYHKLLKYISPIEQNFSVDFYFPKNNLIIEYNGRQHYEAANFGSMDIISAQKKFDRQQARDIFVETFCRKHNIDIIWIDGRIYKGKNLEQYIAGKIIPILTNEGCSI